MINILRYILLGIIIVSGLSETASAQTMSRQDSTLVAIRLHELNARKVDIQKKIEIEDSKRNQSIEGVSYETLERMNRKQDSICLELRSQLVSVELEIAELTPTTLPTQIIQQFNRLRQSQPNRSKD